MSIENEASASPLAEAVSVSVEVAGKLLKVETGALAPQANGAVLVTYGDTVLLVTACAASARPGIDFFPLTVEYRQRRASWGGFRSGFRKREAQTTLAEILGSRITDRTVRPLFPEAYQADTQIIAQVLSAEPGFDPAVLAVFGASAALHISDIPWSGPAAAVRLGRVGGKWVIFPSESQRASSELDLVVSAGPEGLLMVEGELREVPEERVVEALLFAEKAIAPLIEVQRQLRAAAGEVAKQLVVEPEDDPHVAKRLAPREAAIATAFSTPKKADRRAALSAARAAALAEFSADVPERRAEAARQYAAMEYRVAREVICAGVRFDGRPLTAVRPLASRVNLLPRAHGSALFARGETQALATAVLGSASDQEVQEELFEDVKERFYLNYNFPPFSTGETKPLRAPGRREIGHGTLAQRALAQMMPSQDTFPYTVRLISDILSSNGSSSMATVCAGTLAMLDAGVPLRAPVAGIAMGLIKQGGQIAVLTDILGDEDHLGDMDFKVCGTRGGVTALQMDIKIDGLDESVLRRALAQAKDARLHILEHMAGTIGKPRSSPKDNAPAALVTRIEPNRIGELIGPGGKNIKEIQASTQTTVNIEDGGRVVVFGANRAAAEAGVARIRAMFREPVVGEIIEATIKNAIEQFAFVELFPGTEAAIHVSEWADGRIASLKEVAVPGETVRVKVLGVDKRGRIAVSRKAAIG